MWLCDRQQREPHRCLATGPSVGWDVRTDLRRVRLYLARGSKSVTDVGFARKHAVIYARVSSQRAGEGGLLADPTHLCATADHAISASNSVLESS